MPKGYWIGQVDVSDLEGFRAYQRANQPIFAKYGARYLVRGAKSEVGEGRLRSSHVIIEFPSYEEAIACFQSPEYQEVRSLRLAASVADVAVVSGYQGTQPS